MMRVCVQNVDMTARYNAHSHSFSDTNIFMQTQWHNSYPTVENRNYEGWNFNSDNYLFTTDIK